MLKGCLFLLVILVGGYFVEESLLAEAGVKFEWWVPALLSLGITITLSNFWGLLQIGTQRRMANIPPSEWQDGDSIGVSGVLKPLRQPLISPLTKQRALIYEYNLKKVSGTHKNRTYMVLFAGFGMAPCAVSTARGPLRLVGFPFMNQFPSRELDVAGSASVLAEYFTVTRFKKESTAVMSAIRQLREITADADGDLKIDSAYGELPFNVRLQREGASGSTLTSAQTARAEEDSFELSSERELNQEYFLSELSAFKGRIEERVVPTDSEVTIFGTYRANPSRIDIGKALSDLSHGMFLGSLGSVLRKKTITAVIFIIIFGAATIMGHLVSFEKFVW